MKRKAIASLCLTFIILFSAFLMVPHIIEATSNPVLSVVLSGTANTYSIPTTSIGSTFKVDVRVDDIGDVTPGISEISYTLTWDPTVLTCTSKTDNRWLPSQSNMGDWPLNGTSGAEVIGQIAFDTTNATACTTTPSVSVTFTFQVVSSGSCVIGLGPSDMGVPYLKFPNSHGFNQGVDGTTTINATYGSLNNSPIHGPSANFTPAGGSIFKLGSVITLDASSSLPGKDTQTCPITNYAWSVEYLNGTKLIALSGETVSFTPQVAGSFRITLIVTANDVEDPPSPSYSSTDSLSSLINMVPDLQSVSIDLFTDKGGIGPRTSSGAYGPLQLVQTYALVECNGTAMTGAAVMFTIVDATGTSYYRQGVTNETGIAMLQPDFRLPSPNYGSSQTGFGKWLITASVNVLGVNVNDTTDFNFNYLNGIENVVVPNSIRKGETLPIQLTINNQQLTGYWTQLSITLFDQANMPIGSSALEVTQQTQNITVVVASIMIPSWAFAGEATMYLCIFTNSTNIPLAPEAIVNFNILS